MPTAAAHRRPVAKHRASFNLPLPSLPIQLLLQEMPRIAALHLRQIFGGTLTYTLTGQSGNQTLLLTGSGQTLTASNATDDANAGKRLARGGRTQHLSGRPECDLFGTRAILCSWQNPQNKNPLSKPRPPTTIEGKRSALKLPPHSNTNLGCSVTITERLESQIFMK